MDMSRNNQKNISKCGEQLTGTGYDSSGQMDGAAEHAQKRVTNCKL